MPNKISPTLSKTDYLEIRQKIMRQVGRKQKELEHLEQKNLSKEGLIETGILKGYISSTENTIDIFDEYFGLPVI